jgi:outer membrane autotransporter protein
MIKNSSLKYLLAASSISALMFSTSTVFASGNTTKDLLASIKAGKALKKVGPVVSSPVLFSVEQIKETIKVNDRALNGFKRELEEIEESEEWYEEDIAKFEEDKRKIQDKIDDARQKLNQAKADLAEAQTPEYQAKYQAQLLAENTAKAKAEERARKIAQSEQRAKDLAEQRLLAEKVAQEEAQRLAAEAYSARIDKLAENSLDELIRKRQEKIDQAEKEYNKKLSELGSLSARRAVIADEFNEADVDTSEFDEAIKRRKELDKPVGTEIPVVKDTPKEVVGVKGPLVSIDSGSIGAPSVPLPSSSLPTPPSTDDVPAPPPMMAPPPPPPPMMAPPPPLVKQDIFSGVNERINDKSLNLYERFSILFAVPKPVLTDSVSTKSTATQAIDASALMASLNSGESALERLKRLRQEKAAKGAKPTLAAEKGLDTSKSLKEELAEAVKKNPVKISRPIAKAINLKDETHEKLISIAEEVGYELTEKQKTYLQEGEALKSRIDAGENLSRKENVIVSERASIIALIDNAKKKRASELIAQRKENSAKRKAELAANPEALAALAASAEARKRERIEKADAREISLSEAQKSIDNISSIHARLVSIGQEQLAARGKTATKPVVSPQLLKKLVIQGIVPKGREMLEGGEIINQFKSAEREQLNTFMLEMSEADRQTAKELVAFFDNEGNLSPIIDALGQKTKQESTTSTPVMTASDDRGKLFEEIRAGKKLRKAPVQNRPEVTIDAPAVSDKEALKQALAARMGSAKGSTSGIAPVTLESAKANVLAAHTQLTHQGKGEYLAKGMSDRGVAINKAAFKALIDNGIVPTPLEMYGIETRDMVKVLTTKLSEINKGKLKSFLAEKAVNGQGEFIEAFITVIEREDKQLGRELRTPLSDEEIGLLKKVEVELKGMDEQTATNLAQDRAVKSAKLAEILAEAEKTRKKGATLKPLSKKTKELTKDISDSETTIYSLKTLSGETDELVSAVLDSEGNEKIKEELIKELLADYNSVDSESDQQEWEALSKETGELVNAVLDSEGNQKIKEKLLKELLAYHEETRIKKVKAQEVVLAVIQDPEKTAEALSEVDFDFNENIQESNSDNELSSTSSINKAVRYLAHMQNLESEEIDQEIKRFKQHANPITPEISNILFSSMFTQFENRMLMVGAAAGEGVAAGEEAKKLNKSVWISGFYGGAKQGSSSNADAYRTNTGGLTIGADINLGENEANLIGVAYGKARSKFKMSQTRGDKFNVNHDTFSIYGQGEIVNRLLLQGAVSFIKGKVVNKSVKLIDDGIYETATGKFNTKGYNIRSQLSYKFNIDKFVLTPSIGFKYGKIADGAYDETGNDVFNLSVTSKSRKVFTGIAGIKASMPQVVAENIHFVPSLNFSVERILQDKIKQAKVKLTWADREFENDTNNRKLPKLGYNIGGSVLVKRNNTEVEASYNCHLKKKYVGHQGTLKLKLLF